MLIKSDRRALPGLNDHQCTATIPSACQKRGSARIDGPGAENGPFVPVGDSLLQFVRAKVTYVEAVRICKNSKEPRKRIK